MIRKKFKEIASHINCEYVFSQEYFKSIGGSNIPVDSHNLTVNHNSAVIKLTYEFGNTSIGEITSIIETMKELPNITVVTKSQIKRLFSKNKSPFVVKTDDSGFKTFFIDALESCNYNQIAKKTVFEPEIKGFMKGDEYIIRTKFYLGFDDKEMSILPSINLHKKVIDKIKTNANKNKNYSEAVRHKCLFLFKRCI
jgi:hypothetical protein